MQTSDALGAAASQLGPDAQASVVELNKQAGLSHGKVSRVLESLFGISLAPGGSVHTVLRAARRCEPVYDTICQSVARSACSVWRTCWQQGRSALDFLSHLLRDTPVALALPSLTRVLAGGGHEP
ncbi:MAG TPA: hypothetical protein VH592_08815 [Gemmataceae bacterium]